jgi:hypothetical protein
VIQNHSGCVAIPLQGLEVESVPPDGFLVEGWLRNRLFLHNGRGHYTKIQKSIPLNSNIPFKSAWTGWLAVLIST